MKIIQVVSLFTPDGAFGGPTRVAINQTRELRRGGHEVALAGGAMGFGKNLPVMVDGVPVRLFPAHRLIPHTGFAGLTSPGLFWWLRRAIGDADVVHIHLARDLLTLPAAAMANLAKKPYVLQPHGMIDAPSKPLATVLDWSVTKSVLKHARATLCLTPDEQAELISLTDGKVITRVLPNGVPEAEATAEQKPLNVLFLARLHERKRPDDFVTAALKLTSEFPTVTFSLVGPDEGRANVILRMLADAGSPTSVTWEGALAPDHTLDRMRDCATYVLPAVNEPFGMTVLEAMSIGRPVIVRESCALSAFVRRTQSGIVIDDSAESLTEAIRQMLSNRQLRRTFGANARIAAQNEYGMRAIADRLTTHYEDALRSDSHRSHSSQPAIMTGFEARKIKDGRLQSLE